MYTYVHACICVQVCVDRVMLSAPPPKRSRSRPPYRMTALRIVLAAAMVHWSVALLAPLSLVGGYRGPLRPASRHAEVPMSSMRVWCGVYARARVRVCVCVPSKEMSGIIART